MGTQLFINNFRTSVAATFGATDTTLQLSSAAGLPDLTGDQFYKLTLFRINGVEESGHEVVTVTARTGTQCTVVRSVEGAPASQFLAGSVVAARVTAQSMMDKADAVSTATALASKADAATMTAALSTKADAAAVTTALANKADVTAVAAQIASLISAAPGALDTLNELAAALGNDPNFATTMTNALATKAALVGATFTGPINVPAAASGNNAPRVSEVIKKSYDVMAGNLGFTRLDKGTVSTGTVTFDVQAGFEQRLQVNGALTIAFTNWPAAGTDISIKVKLVNAGSAIVTLPTILWVKPDGTTTTSFSNYLSAIGRPSLQSAGVDFAVWWSDDNGTTIYGKLV